MRGNIVMKITGFETKDKNNITLNKKVVKGKKDSFLKEMDSSLHNKSKKDLKELMDSIKKKGDRIVLTKTHGDVIEYKSLVKEYLNKVMDNMYELNKCSDTFNSRYYLTVETIDKKLKDLTDKVLGTEKDNISILTTIDEIQGLLLDVYK